MLQSCCAESIAEAYERFNDYIHAVPHHKFSREDVVQKFYQGLTTASRGIIDALAGGSIIELADSSFQAIQEGGRQ